MKTLLRTAFDRLPSLALRAIPRTSKVFATPDRRPAYLTPPGPIRVGFVVHVMQVAGAEVLVRETIHRLKGQIEPTIFCLDSIGSIGEQLRGEGIPVVCLNRKPKRDYAVSWRMAEEIRARQIDVVHAHQYSPFFYAALAKVLALKSFRLILTEHGRHYPDIVSPARRSVNRLALSHLADAVNACCHFSARALCAKDGFPGRRIEVIENGIDLSRRPETIDRAEILGKLGLPSNRRYVSMVARFHAVKDHRMMLAAFARVATVEPDVDLLLVGEGPGRADLEALAVQLGIGGRVKFLGLRSDVPEILAVCDLFALTSVSEAASLTLMEAMAAGCPVVVCRVGGNPELVRDQVDGLLVPRGDAVACSEAILKILRDDSLANHMRESARHRAEERFSLSKTVDCYFNLYRRLAGRGAQR